MPKFRYVAVSPLRIEDKPRLGPAIYLHEFLVDHQTDAEGRVNYGKVISYAWIRSRWQAAPCKRTLKRHMARLKAAGLVWTEKVGLDLGMRITLLRSAKWAEQAGQISLFPPPAPVSIACGKPVSKQLKPDQGVVTELSPRGDTFVPAMQLRTRNKEKNKSNPARFARSSPVEDAEAIAERRRLLKDQARQLMAKANTAG